MTFPAGNQSSTATPTEPGQGAAQGATPPEQITPEFLDQKIKAAVAEAETRLAKQYQGAQSINSQVRTELKNLDSVLKRLEGVGVKIEPSAVGTIRSEILAGEVMQEPAQQQPGAPAGQPQQPEVDPVQEAIFSAIEKIQAAHGLELLDEDPEVEMIPDINAVGVKGFYDGLESALKAKKLRLEKDTPGRAQARSPALGATGSPSSNPIQNLHGSELWDAAFKK